MKYLSNEDIREIVYRNWKNGDEVGLFSEIVSVRQKDIEAIGEMFDGEKCIKDDINDPFDAISAFKTGYNDAITDIKKLLQDLLNKN